MSNVKCISNQCIKVNIRSIVWCCIRSKIMPEFASQRKLSKYVITCTFAVPVFQPWFHLYTFWSFWILLFLLFEYQILFNAIKFKRYIFSVTTIFYWWERYAMKFRYWSKSIAWKYYMFHEMLLKLYFMKYSERKVSQCILALRTAFLWNTFGGCFCIFSKVIKEPFRKSYDVLIIFLFNIFCRDPFDVNKVELVCL